MDISVDRLRMFGVLPVVMALMAAGLLSSSASLAQAAVPCPSSTVAVEGVDTAEVVAEDLDRQTSPEDCDLQGDIIVDTGPDGSVVVGAAVPEPGDGITVNVTLVDDVAQTLSIDTDEDGTVTLYNAGPEEPGVPEEEPPLQDEPSEPSPTPVATPETAGRLQALTECNDAARTDNGFRWNRRLDWFFKTSTSPPGPSLANVVTDLRNGYFNFPQTRNACGFGDVIVRTDLYRGGTTRGSGIDNLAICFESDNQNTVDFGVLETGSLAVNCSRRSNGIAAESDIKFNRTQYPWFTLNIPAGCTDAFSVEAVMTHEAGHSWGLGHVNEADHGYMTMSTNINRCDRSAVSLGLGDVQGVQIKN